jgi:hypothetical protein
MRLKERKERTVLWRNLRTRRARILDDQGLDAHRRENIRREDGVHGQPLGDGGDAGVSMHGGACAGKKGQLEREEKRGQQDLKRLASVPSLSFSPKGNSQRQSTVAL